MKKVLIKKETYYDSVFLMLASKILKEIEGIVEAVASMGTATNIDLIKDIGFDVPELETVRPNDLIIAVEAHTEEAIDAALAALDDFLQRQGHRGGDAEAYRPVSLRNAIRFAPESNLVLISVPGPYAAREARIALDQGLHVMIFSDHVAIEDEIALKKIAWERGLLMMGPDCGTAIINGMPLCFANRVRRGAIGLVAASGSGLQEVACCIHKMGGGISQALGTGGRDLKEPRIGGRMMKMGIQALSADEATRVLVVISKPPAPELAEDIITRLEKSDKAAVVCFLGQPQRVSRGNLHFAANLTAAARLAVELAGAAHPGEDAFDVAPGEIEGIAAGQIKQMNSQQRYLRGLYAGGTLADEAIFELESKGLEVNSNIQPKRAFLLPDPHRSRKHTIVDLGDDAFTAGRPHPMIDPFLRAERLETEMADPQAAVVLMDFVLGDGAHEDPVGQMMESLARARNLDRQTGRHLAVVASITGTDRDFQDMGQQKRLLEAHNCIVMPSNYHAVRMAAAIIHAIGRKGMG